MRWTFDVLVTVLVGVAAIPPLVEHHHDHPLVLTVAATVVQVLPLLARRVFPLASFAAILVLVGVAAAVDPFLVVGAAPVLSLYTVATMLPRRQVVWAAALLEAAVIGIAIRHAGVRWWYDGIFLSGLVAAALGLGLYTATRRAYLSELHDRAERIERDRDQQIALAAAGERARIAREMHDIVAHHLTVMVALSDGAVAATKNSPDRATEAMRTVSATGRRALSDTRRLLGVLRQPPQSGSAEPTQPVPDLSELDGLIGQVRAAGLPTTVEVHGARPHVTAGIQLTAYRVVQEALTNTLKHGGPDAHAVVRLDFAADELRMQIDDDGAGATAARPAVVGTGLIGMRERIVAYGGDLQSGPRRPAGWRVSARLRLDEADE